MSECYSCSCVSCKPMKFVKGAYVPISADCNGQFEFDEKCKKIETVNLEAMGACCIKVAAFGRIVSACAESKKNECMAAKKNPNIVEVTWTEGRNCIQINCPPRGACCVDKFNGSYSCADSVSEFDCANVVVPFGGDDDAASSKWYAGAVCGEVDCTVKGACCTEQGQCFNDFERLYCNGEFSPDTDCSELTNCIPKGACCMSDGSCISGVVQEFCGDGNWYQLQTCEQIPCCPLPKEICIIFDSVTNVTEYICDDPCENGQVRDEFCYCVCPEGTECGDGSTSSAPFFNNNTEYFVP